MIFSPTRNFNNIIYGNTVKKYIFNNFWTFNYQNCLYHLKIYLSRRYFYFLNCKLKRRKNQYVKTKPPQGQKTLGRLSFCIKEGSSSHIKVLRLTLIWAYRLLLRFCEFGAVPNVRSVVEVERYVRQVGKFPAAYYACLYRVAVAEFEG